MLSILFFSLQRREFSLSLKINSLYCKLIFVIYNYDNYKNPLSSYSDLECRQFFIQHANIFVHLLSSILPLLQFFSTVNSYRTAHCTYVCCRVEFSLLLTITRLTKCIRFIDIKNILSSESFLLGMYCFTPNPLNLWNKLLTSCVLKIT